MTSKEWLLLTALAAMFSCTFLFNRIALGDLRPFTVVLGRVGLAAVLLNAGVAPRGQNCRGRPD